MARTNNFRVLVVEAISRTVLLLTTMALALVMASGIALAESELDQQQTLTDGGFTVINQTTTETTEQAQTFTAGKTGTLDKVSLPVGCCVDASGNFGGTPPPLGLMVLVQEVNSSTGLLNGEFVGLGSVPDSSFSTDGSLSWVDFPLSPLGTANGTVHAGEQYAIRLSVNTCLSDPYPGEEDPCPPLSTSGYQWGRATSDAYSGGKALTYSYSSGTWQAHDEYDFAFKTFVSTDVTAPQDTTPPETNITSGPDDLTNDSTPTFSFSGSDDLSQAANLLYSYKVDSGEWSAYTSEMSVTLGGTSGLSEGAHTFYVKAKDEASNEDASPAQQSFTVDSVAPAGTVSINDGALRTRTRSVTLTLSASDPSAGSGVSQMRISNTQSGLSSASWEAYATTRSWTLSPGTGTKTVYVQYRDAATNVSAVVQVTITYKT